MSNDAARFPDTQLTEARAATSFVSELLRELDDADFDGDSLLPGWTRRQVVAHLAENARAVGRLVSWAATGVETPMYESREVRDRDIDTTAQLDPAALRALFRDTAAQLDAAWLALPESGWSVEIRAGQGRIVPAIETFWMRIRELWVHGVDLNAGAGFDAVPEPVLRRTLGDVVAFWQTAGLRLDVDAPHSMSLGDDSAAQVVSGNLADLTGWATGRTTVGISSAESPVPAAPRWI
jgi:maleylpyruvate isomerase